MYDERNDKKAIIKSSGPRHCFERASGESEEEEGRGREREKEKEAKRERTNGERGGTRDRDSDDERKTRIKIPIVERIDARSHMDHTQVVGTHQGDAEESQVMTGERRGRAGGPQQQRQLATTTRSDVCHLDRDVQLRGRGFHQ